MADSSVPVTGGSGYSIDTFTQSSGDHRQAVVLGDPSASNTVSVDTNGRLNTAVSGYSLAGPTAVVISTSAIVYTMTVGLAGNITFWFYNTAANTATSGTVVFEQSFDGTNWAPLPVVRSDTNAVASTFSGISLTQNQALAFDAAMEGVNSVRVRNTVAGSNTMNVVAAGGGMPFSPIVSVGNTPAVTVSSGAVTATPPSITKGTAGSVGFTTQDIKDGARTPVVLLLDGTTAAAASTETDTAYTGYNGTTAIASGTARFSIASGQRFRIQSMHLAATGTAAGTVKVRLRYVNGTISASSPIACTGFIIVPAASGGDSNTLVFPDGLDIVGPNTFGISYFATATTLTMMAAIHGFIY